MCHFNQQIINMCKKIQKKGMSKKKFYQFVQSYSLKQEIKNFGIRKKRASYKEMKLFHDRTVFKPVKVGSLTKLKRQRAMEILIFLTEKRDKSVEARTCANESTQMAYILKEAI